MHHQSALKRHSRTVLHLTKIQIFGQFPSPEKQNSLAFVKKITTWRNLIDVKRNNISKLYVHL